MLRPRAVDAERRDAPRASGRADRIADRRAVAQVLAVTAAERDPRLDAGDLVQELGQDRRLAPARDRLDREYVGARGHELRDPGAVGPCDLVVGRAPVVARVLGAVREDDGVGPEAPGHEPRAAAALAGAPGQLDAEAQKGGALVAPHAGRLESLERRVVARRDGDVRARLEVRDVNVLDRLRVVAQQPRRPERIAQVVAAGLELRGETAVEDDVTAREQRREGLHACAVVCPFTRLNRANMSRHSVPTAKVSFRRAAVRLGGDHSEKEER